jgi:hypothetical protein
MRDVLWMASEIARNRIGNVEQREHRREEERRMDVCMKAYM